VVPTTADHGDLTPDPPATLETSELPTDGGRPGYLRNAAVMTIGTSLSRATGLIRVAVQAWAMGVAVSGLADTYNRANVTPNIVYEIVLGGILTSVFVPVFVEWTATRGRDEAWAVADRVLSLTTVVLTVGAIVGILLAPWIMRFYLVASEATDRERQIQVGAFFLRWFMPQMIFYGIGAVAGGVLNAGRRFAAPMFAPVVNNLVVIVALVAYALMRGDAPASLAELTTAQATVLAAGTTLGVASMTLALWPSLRALGYRWRLRLDWRHPAVSRLVRLSGWVVVYVAANQLAYQMIIVISGHVGDGAFTTYQWAFLIFSLPHAIFAVSIFTALLPGMAERWTVDDRRAVRDLFSRGVRDTAVIVVPAAFGFIALAVPICSLILARGQTRPEDAEWIGRTLQAFAVGLPFFSSFQLLTRTFYAMQDSRTPALTNVAAAAVNLGADLLFVLAFGWGVPGLALGHAVSYGFGTTVLATILHRRLGSIDGPGIARTLSRTVPAAVVTALSALGVASIVEMSLDTGSLVGDLLQVVFGVGVGVLVFLGCALIFGIKEVDDVISALSRRFRG
jgi:putative peptidoglycan lipid II flippase